MIFMRQRLRLAVDHHDGFIAAIKAHDENTVVDLVFKHWELSRENMELYVAPEGMKVDTPLETPTPSGVRSAHQA